jgi:hypothetical protein
MVPVVRAAGAVLGVPVLAGIVIYHYTNVSRVA